MSKAQGIAQSANQGQFKNRIINGAMMIDQRNAGASVTPSAGTVTYTIDRWLAFQNIASKFSVQQNAGSVTPPTGFTNYLGVTSLSSYSSGSSDIFVIAQRIEGFNTADLAFGTASASPVTISFWVRSSLTGTFGASIKNSAGNRSYPFSYVINSANTWEQKSVTIAGDTTGTWLTNNGIGLVLTLDLGSGSTYKGTANTWASSDLFAPTGNVSVVGTNGATFYITGVQLEKGSTATSFDYRPYGTELALCQRYFEGCSGSLRSSGIGSFNGTHISFKQTKRATPTMTYISNGPVSTNNTFAGFITQDTNGSGIQFNATNSSGEQFNYGFTVSASAEL